MLQELEIQDDLAQALSVVVLIFFNFICIV